jgi:adenine-specific DNA-methyltransferase
MSIQKNSIINGDCVQVLPQLPAASIDFILTDPPYLVNYRSRDGRAVPNDDNDRWLRPAFREMYRVLKENTFCVSFYGWTKTDRFINAWKAAGFRIVGHFTFKKQYASSAGFVKYQHENAYLLAKGHPPEPKQPIGDVLDFPYSGNRLHPTQKPLTALKPLIQAFSKQGDVVLDCFCGSGSSLLAAKSLFRNYLGIELDPKYSALAQRRLDAVF